MGAHFIRAVHERADAAGKKLDGGDIADDGSGAAGAVFDCSESPPAAIVRSSDGAIGADEQTAGGKPRREDSMYAANVAAEPVHLVMLCDFAFVYDPEYTVRDPITKVTTHLPKWRYAKALSGRCVPSTYSSAAPLFKTYRMVAAEPTPNLPFTMMRGNGKAKYDRHEDILRSTDFDEVLRHLVSITLVHLPLVPKDVGDLAAWQRVVTAPSHQAIVTGNERLRKWLHLLAHTEVVGEDNHLQPPTDLKGDAVFEESLAAAQKVLGEQAAFENKEARTYEGLWLQEVELRQTS